VKKIGSRMHSDPKFDWRGGGVTLMPGRRGARKKRFRNAVLACILLRKNWNSVPARSVTKIASGYYHDTRREIHLL
jgi:hypothetical protein